MLCQSYVFCLLFFAQYLQDCQANLNHIFQENAAWAATENLSFGF